jgi:hypothetical protein
VPKLKVLLGEIKETTQFLASPPTVNAGVISSFVKTRSP